MKKLWILALALAISFAFCFSVFNDGSLYTASQAEEDTLSFPTVIIDAGHGGFDGGASTDEGVPEKNINLDIALNLRDYLSFLGFKTRMVRTEDVSTDDDGLSTIKERKTSDLHNRMKLIEETENALFISIHQNHFSVNRYWGAQMFYGPVFADESSLLAQCVQENIVNDLQPENTRQIKPCSTSVYLIFNAPCPALLAECGFLSNPEEAKMLQTPEYRAAIAVSIAHGILDYCTKVS